MHPEFVVAEQAGARWRRRLGEAPPTPAASPRRTGLDEPAYQFLVRASGTTGAKQASYREAAAAIDRERRDLITAAGRQSRIVRVGQGARTGPDGPSPGTSTPLPLPDSGQTFLEDPSHARVAHLPMALTACFSITI